MSREISLATYWGWHFHRVLFDLRVALDQEFRALAEDLNCVPPKKLELFRRSWFGSPKLFLFRWSFFDAQSENSVALKQLMDRWKDSTLAKSFIEQVSALKGEFPIGSHIANLNQHFFNGESLSDNSVEDWRALYLQTPTKGTILQHLWDAPKRSDCRAAGFLVSPEFNNKQRDANLKTDFGPFHFQTILPRTHEDGKERRRHLIALDQEEEWSYISRQEEIRILSNEPQWDSQTSQDLGSKFFQKNLYKWFYSEDQQDVDQSSKSGPTTKLIQKLNIKYFLFIPIYLGRNTQSQQWLGMLQIRFMRRTEEGSAVPPGALKKFRERVIHLGEIAQILANDLIVAHVQESFNRPFPGLTGQRKLRELYKEGCRTIINIEKKSVHCRTTWSQLEQLSEAEYQRMRMKVAIGRNLARNFIKEDHLLNKLNDLRSIWREKVKLALQNQDLILARNSNLAACGEVKALLQSLSKMKLVWSAMHTSTATGQGPDGVMKIANNDVLCADTRLQLSQLYASESQKEHERLETGREQARHFFGHENLLEDLDDLRDSLEKLGRILAEGKSNSPQSAMESVEGMMDSIISTVCDLGGEVWTPKGNVDVEEAIQSRLDKVKHLIETLSLTAKVSVKPKGLKAKLDQSKFNAMLYNPIRNSLNAIGERYKRKPGGCLNIQARLSQNILSVAIRDNGKKLTKHQILDLWNDPPGIGLYLAKEYAESSGGEITLLPTNLQGFKTTVIKIPIKQHTIL